MTTPKMAALCRVAADLLGQAPRELFQKQWFIDAIDAI